MSVAIPTASSKPTIVFVHGAWHGAWCWASVSDLLRAQGHSCVAIDLPGHGMFARVPKAYSAQPQDPAALASEVSPLARLGINDYRDHVLATLRALDPAGHTPVVLVGHSLGGATLSAVAQAQPARVKQLVYLSAFVPVKHDAVIAYLTRPEFESSLVPPMFAADPAAVAAVRINHRSTQAGARAQCKQAFYAHASDDAFEAAQGLLTPDEPIGAFAEPVHVTAQAWGSVPRTYIRCTQDQAIPIAGQDAMIAEADAFTPHNPFVQLSLASDHSPFVSHPQALADMLSSLCETA